MFQFPKMTVIIMFCKHILILIRETTKINLWQLFSNFSTIPEQEDTNSREMLGCVRASTPTVKEEARE